ncbi:unnamed protein product [Discula destructiva]
MPFLQIGYKQIHLTDYKPSNTGHGPSDDTKTIICHHGLGSSQNFYQPIVPDLVSAGFRVIIFDATGAARSPYTQVEQSIASLASDVVSILDAFALPKAVVMGHSMGGIVASHLAQDSGSRDRIQAIILVGPVYPSAGLSQVFEKRIDLVQKEGMSTMADTVPFTAPGSNASPLVRAFIRELLLGQTAQGYLSHCRVISGSERPCYESITAPVLLIAGEEDRSADLAMCKKMFQEIGSKEKHMELLKGVGHWHCLETPELVTQKVLNFLKAI